MTAHVAMARVPFAPLDNPRLQHLASAKNRQNGLLAQKSSSTHVNGKISVTKPISASIITKSSITKPINASITKSINASIITEPTTASVITKPITASITKPLNASIKRSSALATLDDCDSENVDPSVCASPSKRTKSAACTFTPTSAKSMPPPSALPARTSTPIRATIPPPRTPLTAPAGRSPPKRMAAPLKQNRRILAPFSRIGLPCSSSPASSSTLPFGLDAVLTTNPAESPAAGASVKESMPPNWFFDIHSDTAEDEATNLMEHSTLILDLGSDDEGRVKQKHDRGKENTPP